MVIDNIEQIASLSLNERKARVKPSKPLPLPGRRIRSHMMLNPLRLHHLNRLDTLDADVVTLNLEDAIAPARKEEALINAALFISHLKKRQSLIVVRVNPLHEGGDEEIAFLNEIGCDAVRIPKVKRAEEIAYALSILDEHKELHISLETKEAFCGLKSLAFDKRLTVANLGILDLLTSFGLPQNLLTFDNPTILHILTKVLLDAKSVGIEPVGFMYQDYEDTQGFRRWCEIEKRIGFRGKACMGPKQVAIANEVFGTNEAELERARQIKALFEEASKQGEHAIMHPRYGFIDEPIYRDALMVLERTKET